jgi:pimeloyl-ACP methyl ester carboxylesterase
MSLHTWSAYRDAVSHLVIDTDWAELLAELDHNGTHVALVWGTHDRVGDDRHAQALASRCRRATVTIVEGADHHLPMSHPAICIDQLTASDDRSTD